MIEPLRDFVKAHWNKNEVPGFVIGILQNGERIILAGGVTNVEQPTAVTEETLFQIGSISRIYTTTAVLKLAGDGKIDLDAPVQAYLPDFRVAEEEASRKVTVRHLLTHACGWEGDFFIDTGQGRDALAEYVAQLSRAAQLAPVGTLFSYNNSAFSVAGRIIEVVSGLPFEQALGDLVLRPLQLQHTFFGAADVITRPFAVGHHLRHAGPVVARPWALPRALHPVGGIVTDIGDLLRIAEFHLGSQPQEGWLLTPALLRGMQSPLRQIWGDHEAMGLSWFITQLPDARLLWHQGSTNGQISSVCLVPAKNFAIGVMTNSSAAEAFTQTLIRWALRQHLGLKLEVPEPKPVISLELERYAGKYTRPFAEVEIFLKGRSLKANFRYLGGFPTPQDPPPPAPPEMSLALCGEDRFLILDGPSKNTFMEAIRAQDGSIRWWRAFKRVHLKVQ